MKLTCNACGFCGAPDKFHHALSMQHDFQCHCGSTDIDTSALAVNPAYKYGANNTLKPMGRTK